jgi:hypothetical protein
MNPSTGRDNAKHGSHECDHGFCLVCGMVWPCSSARRHGTPAVLKLPTPRLPTIWS